MGYINNKDDISKVDGIGCTLISEKYDIKNLNLRNITEDEFILFLKEYNSKSLPERLQICKDLLVNDKNYDIDDDHNIIAAPFMKRFISIYKSTDLRELYKERFGKYPN